MRINKKTFKNSHFYKLNRFSHDKTNGFAQNNYMENKKCNVHVMPSQITDADISALFNGLLNVVKKKFELDYNQEFLNVNIEQEKLKSELKNKIKECNKLKNEIIYLKSILEKNNIEIN